MIITEYKGASFSRTLRYVSEKPGARLLLHNLFCSTTEEQNAAMLAVAQRSELVQKPMVHYAISLSPGERLTGSEWRSLARQYLREMGYTDNQYLLVRHTDTPNHDHVHVVVNRVQRSSGKAVHLGWGYYKSEALARQLETQFNLSPVRASWERFTERLPGEDEPLLGLPPDVEHRQGVQAQIRGVVNEGLLLGQSLEEFIRLLESRGVRVELKQRRGESQGIAFSYGNERFTGSQLGAGYSLPKLMNALQDDAVAEVRSEPVEEPFHQRYYRELVDLVESRLGAGLSVREKDFQIAMLALRSSKPDAAKALVFSPDVQRLKQEQGEQVAMDYLRELMEEAQGRLREVQQQTRERQRELERE